MINLEAPSEDSSINAAPSPIQTLALANIWAETLGIFYGDWLKLRVRLKQIVAIATI